MQSIAQGSVTMNVALHMPDGNVQAGLPGSLTIKRLQAETQTGEDDDDGYAQAMAYLTEGQCTSFCRHVGFPRKFRPLADTHTETGAGFRRTNSLGGRRMLYPGSGARAHYACLSA